MKNCADIRKLLGLNNHALTPPTFPFVVSICIYIRGFGHGVVEAALAVAVAVGVLPR